MRQKLFFLEREETEDDVAYSCVKLKERGNRMIASNDVSCGNKAQESV